MAKARQSYHHGDLRKALIEAGIAILAEGGTEGLTLRAAAARAGVSHAAPAHHFGSLQGLLTAIATVGFERFHAAIDLAMAIAPPSPVERLRAAGRAYVGFAIAHPAIVQLMFSGPRLDWSRATLCVAADRAYLQLTDIVAPAAEHLGATDEASRSELALMVWSSVHGYAHLAIAGVLDRGATGKLPPVPDVPGLLFGAWKSRRRK
ncbi:MAG: TetR/AcrR family transcriptional regulator [Hyphomicrobiaceae bacterium]